MSKNASKLKAEIRRSLFKYEAMQEVGDHLIAKQLAVDLCHWLEATNNAIPDFAADWWARHKPEQPPSTQAQEKPINN